jgi:hypothetical protein
VLTAHPAVLGSWRRRRAGRDQRRGRQCWVVVRDGHTVTERNCAPTAASVSRRTRCPARVAFRRISRRQTVGKVLRARARRDTEPAHREPLWSACRVHPACGDLSATMPTRRSCTPAAVSASRTRFAQLRSALRIAVDADRVDVARETPAAAVGTARFWTIQTARSRTRRGHGSRRHPSASREAALPRRNRDRQTTSDAGLQPGLATGRYRGASRRGRRAISCGVHGPPQPRATRGALRGPVPPRLYRAPCGLTCGFGVHGSRHRRERPDLVDDDIFDFRGCQ